MAFTDGASVRSRTGWPAAVTDEKLAPHIADAARALKSWLPYGRYDDLATLGSGDENPLAEVAEEVECCLAVSYALPSLNTFALAAAPVIPKEIEDEEFQFTGVDDTETLVKRWRKRAEDRFKETDWTDEGDEDTHEAAPRIIVI